MYVQWFKMIGLMTASHTCIIINTAGSHWYPTNLNENCLMETVNTEIHYRRLSLFRSSSLRVKKVLFTPA